MDATRALQSLRILHLALCASTALYGVIVFMATPPVTPGSSGPGEIVQYVFAFLGGAILLVGAPMMHKLLLPPRERVPSGAPADLSKISRATLTKVRSGSILTWAMCESVAVLGVISAFLYHQPVRFVPFGVAALAGLAYFTPRATLMDEIANALPDRG